MKTELHVHTRFSNDSLLSLWIVKFICFFKKIDCVAICDHNTIDGALALKKQLKKSNISIIVGEEIFTSDGEIIGLFLKEKISPGLTAEETVLKIKEQCGLVYIPHPYDEKRHKTVLKKEAMLKIANYVDLIEIHNGRNIFLDFSKRQEDIANLLFNRNHTAFVTGSDAHTFFEVGRNYMVSNFYDPNNAVEFKKNMICAENVNSDCIMLAHTVTRISRLLKMLLKGDMGGLFRIIFKKCKNRSRKAG